MVLRFIKTDKCPFCNCKTVVEESMDLDETTNKVKVHTNGKTWEKRRFSCGQLLTYNPVEGCIHTSEKIVCGDKEYYTDLQNKRMSAAEKICLCLDSLDVDDTFKNWIKSNIGIINN